MAWQPRLIASDLDGTLLGGESRLTDRTIAAVQRAIDAGYEFVAATGRSWRSALPKLDPVDIRYVVCANGALVWDRHAESVMIHRPMAAPVVLEVTETLRDRMPTVGFGYETPGGFHFDDVFRTTCPRVDEIGLGTDPGPPDHAMEATKMFVCVPGLRRLDLQNAVGAVLPPTANATASGADFLETTAAGVNKATTVSMLAERLGFDAGQVLAFGDQLNDVPLLEWAGRSVAMANAHVNVTAHADEIAPSNVDDGVAVVLERMLG